MPDLEDRVAALEDVTRRIAAQMGIRPSCPVCGTVMADAGLHQRFHDGLRELARVVYCPEMSPEEYEQAIREQWDRDHASESP